MKQLLLITAIFFTSFSVFADAPRVDLTSFIMAGSNTRAAEICGKVSGLPTSCFIKIVVDHKSKQPGIYNVFVNNDESFCTTVVTYYGTAEVLIPGSTQVEKIHVQ